MLENLKILHKIFGNLKIITIFVKLRQSAAKFNMKVENKSLIIEENPYFDVIGFDYNEYEKHGRKRWFYKIKCKKCNTIFTKRKESIVHKPETIRCPNCHKNRHGVLSVLEYDMLNHYKSNARTRNIKWYLTNEQFKNLITQKCYYCGDEPTIRKTTTYKQNAECVNGIDRIDSTKDYTIDNVVPCCIMCNKMKMEIPKEDFKNQIIKIYKHIIKSSTTISKESTQ